MGLTTHLGNFDECIEVQNVQTDYGTFDAQYCLVDVILSVNTSYINVESLTGFNTQNLDIQIRTQPDRRAVSGSFIYILWFIMDASVFWYPNSSYICSAIGQTSVHNFP